MPRRKDLTGEKYGRLLAMSLHGKSPKGRSLWLFQCDCGAEKIANIADVRYGSVRSCGCLAAEKFAKSNGWLSKTPEYRVWRGMIRRCTRPQSRSWRNYGGRGIKVCDRWRSSFALFYEDMGPRPSSRHSIDRISVDGNYEPGNCRWATAKEQAANKRRRSTSHFDDGVSGD